MSGLIQQIDVKGLDVVISGMYRLSAIEEADVLSIATGVAISSTHRRLRETKTAPDGTPWQEWSDTYAQTRKGHHSLLMNEGDLDDSITEFIDGAIGGVGTNLVYAAVQQFGGEEVDMNTPARPYLGLSKEDEVEIPLAISDFIEAMMQ